MTRLTLPVAVAAFTCLLAGCGQEPPKRVLTIDQILSQYNANAAKIPKLRANPRVSVSFQRQDNPLPFNYTFDTATLLLGKDGSGQFGPYDFVLIGREAGRDIFRLGSNVRRNVYYMWFHAGQNGALWQGRLDLAGAPGVKIPIDPNQLVAALGVTELPNDLTQLPTVGMTLYRQVPRCFSPGEYAYVLTYIDHQPISNRILLRREMFFRWSDTQPPLLYKINFIDPAGERIMTAGISDYQPLAIEGMAAKDQPVVPTRINVVWGANRIDLVLANISAEGAWNPAIASELSAPEGLPVTNVDEDVQGGHAK